MAQGNVERIFRLTPAQEGILFHSIQDAGEGGVYFQQFTCRLAGTVDVARLQAAWLRVVERHAALRTAFTWERRDNPLHVVMREVESTIEVVDDPELVGDGEVLERFLASDRHAGLRLNSPPLSRIRLVRGAQGAAPRLIWSFHHLLLDGWSMRSILSDWLAEYDRPGSLAALPSEASFEAYVAWLGQQDRTRAAEYWRGQLAGFEAQCELGLPRPSESSAERERTTRWSAARTAALTDFARQNRITLSTVLRGAWAWLVARYSGQQDVVFGATVAGRPPELAHSAAIVGMCINTVPVRAQLDLDMSVVDWLRELQRQQVAASEFETLPLVEIQRLAEVPAGTALFETILVFENHPVREERTGLELVDPRYVEQSNYPLALLVVPGDELQLILVYDPERYSAASVAGIGDRLDAILDSFVGAPEARLRDVSWLDGVERDRVVEWARSTPAREVPPTVPVLIGDWIRTQPDRVAVRAADGSTQTYAALGRRSQSVAAGLRAAGVGAGDRVILMLPRGPAMVAAMLGAWGVAAAYVPLDSDAPRERLAGLVAATGARAILTVAETRAVVPDVDLPILDVDRLDDVECDAWAELDPARAAYVIFTSGSTGEPKGVEITHGGLAWSTAARAEVYGDPVERFLLVSPHHFDSSVAGLFWTLSSGGELVLPAVGEERDVRALIERVQTVGVTHTLCLPSLHDALLTAASAEELASLRVVAVAGEACPRDLVMTHRAALPQVRLVNEYGPTEATVWATAHDLSADRTKNPVVPIGRPIGPIGAWVLDPRYRDAAVPVGVAAELLLTGPSLAAGYLDDPARTAERFVSQRLPDGTTERAYRTGDRVRWLEDGTLEFLGRVDQQVKLRGHRIELGEIEARLAAHPDVRAAAITVDTDPQGRVAGLIGYAESSVLGSDAGVDALRRWLADGLPDYMVPRDLMLLSSLPKTSTGKVDRRSLPRPQRVAGDDRAPVGDAETELHSVWCDVLGLERVSTDADFFELGGDSLLAIRIIARAHQRGLRVDAAQFADAPTIAGMAAMAEAAQAASTTPKSGRPSDGPVPLAPIQRWFFGLELPDREHWNQAVVLGGAEDLDPARLRAALVRVVSAHDGLRSAFERSGSGWASRLRESTPITVVSLDRDSTDFADGRLRLHADSGGLTNGALLRAAVIRAAGRVEIELVAHHLVVDAVSWDVIRRDLEAAYADARELPSRGSSFATWAETAREWASRQHAESVRVLWSDVVTRPPAGLPRDRQGGQNSVADERRLEVALPVGTTDQLLRDVPAVYHTQIQDVLLAGLLAALRPWTGREDLVFDLEGHGRDLELGIDATQIVGWLTAVWPSRLAAASDADPGSLLKSVKEQLRRLPNGAGPAFGWLRDYGPEAVRERLAGIPARELLFNHLGRVDIGGSAFEPNGTEPGPCRARTGRRGYVLEINTRIQDGQLRAVWSFCTQLHDESTIQGLAERHLAEIERIVAHCLSPAAGGFTPSDFPLADLDQSELDKLSDLLGD